MPGGKPFQETPEWSHFQLLHASANTIANSAMTTMWWYVFRFALFTPEKLLFAKEELFGLNPGGFLKCSTKKPLKVPLRVLIPLKASVWNL